MSCIARKVCNYRIGKKVVEIGRCIDSQLHLARPVEHRGGGEREEERRKRWKKLRTIIGGGSLRKIGLYWELREGDPYRGSLEAPHSGPSLRRIEVYELSMPWFQRRETFQFLVCVGASMAPKHERGVSSPCPSWFLRRQIFPNFLPTFPPSSHVDEFKTRMGKERRRETLRGMMKKKRNSCYFLFSLGFSGFSPDYRATFLFHS